MNSTSSRQARAGRVPTSGSSRSVSDCIDSGRPSD